MNRESNSLKAEFFADFSDRIDALHALANDPVAFAHIRRAILQDYFRTVDDDKQECVRALQDQIDMEAAVILSPDRMIKQLLGLMNDQIATLEAVTHRSIDNAGCRKV